MRQTPELVVPHPLPSGLPSVTRSRESLYCTGCNERFETLADDPRCPRCGVEVTAVHDPLQETLLLHDSDEDDDAHWQKDDPLVGKELHVYRCEALLGSGGMGRVYLAQHRDLHRKCALKVLAPRLARQDEDYIRRFELEGRAAASLIHPNIVTIHAIGLNQELHFLEMEFVAGPTLQQIIHEQESLAPLRATRLLLQVSQGLAAAHQKGIMHRDLKPDNILLTPAGVPKIADFGLAKRVQSADNITEKYLVGTPNFMAPELFHGHEATPACDVYALGVCYFLLLTGRFPYTGRNLRQLIHTVTTDPLPAVRQLQPEVPLEMAECVTRMLAKSPQNRPQNAQEAAQLMGAVLGNVRDLEGLVDEAFAGDRRVECNHELGVFHIKLHLPDGRTQRVVLESSQHAAADQKLLLIYSICCDADPAYYEEALRMNSEMPHGGLAVRDIDSNPKFVVVDTYPRATVDAEEIRRSVHEVARRADQIEHQLTGLDEH